MDNAQRRDIWTRFYRLAVGSRTGKPDQVARQAVSDHETMEARWPDQPAGTVHAAPTGKELAQRIVQFLQARPKDTFRPPQIRAALGVPSTGPVHQRFMYALHEMCSRAPDADFAVWVEASRRRRPIRRYPSGVYGWRAIAPLTSDL